MSGICAGTPIIAPDGYRSLRAGTTYYFLRSSPGARVVTLVEFAPRRTKQIADKEGATKNLRPLPFPLLIRLHRVDFEEAVLSAQILPGKHEVLPPWLSGLEGLDLEAVDAARVNPAKRHRDRIDDKIGSFYGLLPDIESILDSENTEQIINRHARSLQPTQNESRVRLWLFTYLAFGRNRYALHYPTHEIGRWDRLNTPSKVKRGAPSSEGKGYGFNTTGDMHDRILKSYSALAGIGITDEEIYAKAMKKFFGCQSRLTVKNGKQVAEFFHPKGEGFPTQATYFYYVEKRFPRRQVKEAKWGHNRVRSKEQPYRGAFTESSWNLMQRIEADAYFVQDLPEGYVEGSDLKPLVVVTKRDTVSGKKTGIGFAYGRELAAAYRMATFCEAVGFRAFGRLLGLRIADSAKGVSPYDITDRGAGATAEALSRIEDFQPVIRESAPSYAGQSKAIVETSHPQKRHDNEAPSFRRSNLKTIELARREFGLALQFNETAIVANRVDPDLAPRVTRLTPNGVWEALDSVGRNNAVQVGFEDAVRAYLDVVPAKLTRGGVVLAGRNYYSKTPEFENALSSVAGGQDVNVNVFVLAACTRFIWFEWNNKLIELDVRYPIPVGEEVKYMSFAEAVEYAEYLRKWVAAERRHRAAKKHLLNEDYLEQTGTELKSGSRVAGRPKRGTATARLEHEEARQSVEGRRAA
jgi:hypothetical protein